MTNVYAAMYLFLGIAIVIAALAVSGGVDVEHSVAEISELWFGEFLLVWRPANGEMVALGPGAVHPNVVWLRQSLAAIDARYRAEPLDSRGGASLAGRELVGVPEIDEQAAAGEEHEYQQHQPGRPPGDQIVKNRPAEKFEVDGGGQKDECDGEVLRCHAPNCLRW